MRQIKKRAATIGVQLMTFSNDFHEARRRLPYGIVQRGEHGPRIGRDRVV